MNMIEKVAKAIGDTIYGYVDPAETPNTWGSSMDMARAAIEAMREPTGGMEDAAWDAHEAYEKSDQGFWDGPKSIYKAMIDAALKD